MLKYKIIGHYGSYEGAYDDVSDEKKRNRLFSIQREKDYKNHPWVLIYYTK